MDLLPCPFCGSEAKEWYERKSASCSNRFCSLRNLFTIDDWNRREEPQEKLKVAQKLLSDLEFRKDYESENVEYQECIANHCIEIGELKVQLDEAEKWVGKLKDINGTLSESCLMHGDTITKLKEENQSFGDVLALIHRDGGHYITKHGHDKASKDAVQIVLDLRDELDKYRWIPVEERLPDKTKEDLRPQVLVFDGESVTGALWRHYKVGWDFETDRGKPTHWRETIIRVSKTP